MPRKCSICKHIQVKKIDEWIRDSVPLRDIAEAFSVTKSSLYRHKEQLEDSQGEPKKPQGVFRKISWPQPVRKHN